ncbi:MAG: DUF5777 family beta-barrel protein [Cyclobacteriaceae bacterium]
MKKTLKILLICSGLLFLGSYQVIAQEEDSGKKPVRAPFESAVLIDNQTVIVPAAKTLEFNMVHRFGTIENGKSDLFGLYAPGANIRLGLTYSLKDNLAVGVGFTKLNKYVDFNLKYAILQQTRDWSMPISLTYYGNMAIDTREKELFEESDNPGIHRLSSFNELIVATRINKRISLQVTPSFSYFNKVELGLNSYIVGVGISGRYKFSPQSSFIFDYNQQVTDHDDVLDVKPNLGFGWEISTSTHAFQIFISSFQGILPQHNMMFNENEFDSEGLLIGFNITRLWNF